MLGIVAGIDPGKSGCMCLYNTDNEGISFYDWPKDDNSTLFMQQLTSLNKSCDGIDFAILEKVHAMPKQGVTSMFNFGQNFGMWKAFLAINQIPHLIVTPQQWMKGIVTKSDGKTTKLAVQNVATKLFPKAKLYGSKGAYKDGRGDALLMAYYAKQLQKS